MNLKTCYYCGTKYTEEESRCPLCGQTEIEQDAPEETTAVPVAPKMKESEAEMERHPERPMKKKKTSNQHRGQGTGSTIVCIILALIVIAGIAFILNSLGILNFGGEKTPPQQPDTNLELPVEDQPQTGDLSCTGITVTPASVNLPAQGIKTRLVVNLTPAGCTELVTYASSDESVVAVTQEGEVTAMGPGQATITVACGAARATVDVVCSFEVVPPTPDTPATPDTPDTPATPDTPTEPEGIDYSQLSLSVDDFTLSKDLGLTWTVRVKGVPEGKTISVEWTSDDVEVATVANGKVTAVSTGKTKIRALIDGDKKELSAVVRCVVPETTDEPVDESLLSMSHTDVTLRKEGESFNIYLYKDNTRYAGTKWVSENEEVCVVNEDGRVTAVASGTTNIVGTFEDKTYTCVVRCYLPETAEPNA